MRRFLFTESRLLLDASPEMNLERSARIASQSCGRQTYLLSRGSVEISDVLFAGLFKFGRRLASEARPS